MFAKFINVRFKDNFSYFVVKLKTVGSMEHFEKEFRLRESFELCRNMGKKILFVAEGYLIDDERREGGTMNGSNGTWRRFGWKDLRRRGICGST